MPEVAIVAPLRRNTHRDPLWQFTRQRWETLPWPLIEVWDDGPSLFNRSWCLNRGAEKAGNWDVLLIIDGDVIVPHDQVYAAVERAEQTGNMAFACDERYALNRASTQRVLRGAPTRKWAGMELDRRCKIPEHIRAGCKVSNHNPNSHCLAIPRDFWEEIEGFDERFIGWGFEDMAVLTAHLTFRGEPERIPGQSVHLWHPRAEERRKNHPNYGLTKRLGDRYFAQLGNPEGVQDILDERLPAERYRTVYERNDDTALLVFTDGRRECLEQTLASFEAKVIGQFSERFIIDDSADPDYSSWLVETYAPRYRVISHPERLGFGGSIDDTWRRLPGLTEASHIFHLEDDFLFDRVVDLAELRTKLVAKPRLAQIALLRDAFFPSETRVGGIIQQHPNSYKARDGVVEHIRYFTTNPCLYQTWITTIGWPTDEGSEQGFTQELVRRGFKFAFWGDGKPWITHIGHERAGVGY